VKNSANSLHRGSLGVYRSASTPSPKEEFREGTYPVPHRQYVLGFSGRYLAGDGAGIPPRGREPGGPPASFEDHRGEGHRRPLDHAGRLPERAHFVGRDRAGSARTAANVRRKLIARLSGLAVFGAALGCDQGTPKLSDGKKGPAPKMVWHYPDGRGATNGTIRMQFDRFLSPDTTNRQAFCVSASANAN